ncbi:hypothetical protein CCR75_005580 [Bremia lactucae]|uniref:WRKY19-like zinc finger domain-containing protein n=1 Tax=Bremia lactucae TaxID=4779 RepID=A0A976FFL3_BRELC|nr:hypothetical protein CCR75_005580 [Bremia lactucae]
MCRPIESRDSISVMGLSAAALFPGYQVSSKASANQAAQISRDAPAWSTSGGRDNMNMVNMATPPALPVYPFLSSDMPNMPWNAATSTTNLLRMGLPSDQYSIAIATCEGTPEVSVLESNFEAQELEELLEYSVPVDSDSNSIDKDKPDLSGEGFGGMELSILYSFLMDRPDENSKKHGEIDDGILNLDMLTGSPVEGLVESLESDCKGTDFLMMTCRHQEPHMMIPTVSPTTVVAKSRRLCKSEGCPKRSRSNGLCISHGGGRRCAIKGCDKSSQGGNLCIRHGGGKRCSYKGCGKAAQTNFLCKAHGGGPRCQFSGCSCSSQGGGFCRSHGGGKRCMFDGCDKGTQRGEFCALHGGSRLCEVPNCMRNDRGGGLCATHGGGKRCIVEWCYKPCRRKGLCSAHLRQVEEAVSR